MAANDLKVAAAVEAAAAASTTPVITNEWESKLKPGLKFKIDKVSKYALIAIRNKLPRPQPPIHHMEEKGRSEPNPNHPEYLMNLQDHAIAQSIATVDAYLGLGTEVLSIPNGVIKVEDDAWIEKFEAMGLEIPRTTYPRYVAWIKMYAIPDDEEIADLISTIRRYNGVVIEEEVDEAMDNLKSDDGRSADTETSGTEAASIG